MRANKTRHRRKKISNLTYYVAFSIAVILVYTITELTLAHLTGMTDDNLNDNFFKVFGGEILLCALIKIFKLKEEKNNDE